MNYHHFTIEERCCLREYYIKGKSYREIARLLGRNVSSVSRELRRNCTFYRDIPRYYPHIEVVCANDKREAENLLKDYLRQGYQYFPKKEESFHNIQRENTVETAAVQDTERLVLLLDASYYYDEKGYLRAVDSVNNEKSQVRNLFHQLNQAKEKIALIIKNNETVYENMLELLQSKNKIKK